MKKRIINITIFIFLLLVCFNAKAASRYTVSSVIKYREKYLNAVQEYNENNCNSNLYSQTDVDKCNSLNLERINALSYIYNAKESNPDLVDRDTEKILEENGKDCSTVFNEDIQDIIKKAFLMFYIAGPILLILYGSLDMINAIVAGDEKKRKALFVKFIKRSVALILLFASPAIVNLLVSLFGADKYTANVYTCVYEEKQVTISYTPVISKGNYTSEGDAFLGEEILKGAAEVNKAGVDNGWSYNCVGATRVLSNIKNKTKSTVCCADGVSAALVLAGIFNEEDIANTKTLTKDSCGGYGGNNESATGLQAFLITQGWIKVSRIEDLQPGDVVFVRPMNDVNFACIRSQGTKRAGHVEIYAGDGKSYNFGKTSDINTMGPHKRTYSYNGEYAFIAAYRVPVGSGASSGNNTNSNE